MEIGVLTPPNRAYGDAGKILDSLTGIKTREKINKTNFSAGSIEHWTLESTSWKFTALKIIDKRADLRKIK